MVDGPRLIEEGPARDRVLWQYRTALAAMHLAQFDVAAQHLDDALNRVEGVMGYDRSARKARRYFTPEAKKDFIGEPYERVMAYYYRAILYWMKGDLGNARACYRSAQVMDGHTEEETYAADYALLDYLDGLTTLKLGGDATDELKLAQKHARLGPLPPYDTKANVVFFFNYGNGPLKYASGQYAQELRFRPGVSLARSVQLSVAQKTSTVPPYDDLYFQATTRGGRVMDHILANKAVFKSSTDTAGDAAIITGAVLASDRRNAEVGLGVLAVGILAKAVAGATTPEADVRSWEGLPQYLSFAALELAPGNYVATIEFVDDAKRPLTGLTKTVNFNVPATGGDVVVFVSDKSVSPQNI